MRLALLLVTIALAAVLLWLARSPGRAHEARTSHVAAAEAGSVESALAAPTPVESVEDSAAAGVSGSERERAPRVRDRSPEAAVAPVRGRVVVEGTQDPIEAVLSLRLRTLDLTRSELLVTRSDGSFDGRTLFRRGRLLALVKDADGRELVDHEADFDPTSESDWLVPVPESAWPTFATGRVVDPRGRGVAGALVLLVGGRVPECLEEHSDEEGAFRVDELHAGLYRLTVGHWTHADAQEVRLRAGPNELGDVLLAEPPPAGDLALRIVVDDPKIRPNVWLELRDETGALWRFDTVYEPASVAFSPPATIELHARGERRAGTLFRAHDAGTGVGLSSFIVLGRYGRTWCLFDVRQSGHVRVRPGFETWIVGAPGYRAGFGAFAGAGDALDVALERGWSGLFQCEDAEGDARALSGNNRVQDPPVLADVEVYAGGRLQGVTDAQGFLSISDEREPEEIEFRRAGWSVVGESYLGSLRTVVLARGSRDPASAR